MQPLWAHRPHPLLYPFTIYAPNTYPTKPVFPIGQAMVNSSQALSAYCMIIWSAIGVLFRLWVSFIASELSAPHFPISSLCWLVCSN